jgi:Skp family chaperone for outer membrane proteins
MFRKAAILPICTVTLLAASQFAAAQSIQPISPCPPGKVAQNHNRGTEGAQTAQKHDRGTGGNVQTAQNSDRGTSLQVAGRPIDPLDCR